MIALAISIALALAGVGLLWKAMSLVARFRDWGDEER